jgi:hypothetical protein
VLKFERVVEQNLMVENSLLRLPTEVDCVLSGGCLVTSARTPAAEEALADGLVSLIQGKVAGIRHFLMVGHSSWQPRNRIVMYNKLWLSLEKRTSLPRGVRSEEYLIESEKGVKFFGFMECENPDTRQILGLLRAEPACTLIATCENDPQDILGSVARKGWNRVGIYPPIEILKIACSAHAFIYAVIGFFDDRERGLALIAKSSWIDAIFKLD